MTVNDAALTREASSQDVHTLYVDHLSLIHISEPTRRYAI